MNAGMPDGPHLTGRPADPISVILWQLRACLATGALAGLLTLIASARLGSGRLGEAAEDVWLFGSLSALGWTGALFAHFWSKRAALPQRLPVLLVAGILVVGSVAMGLGRVTGAGSLAAFGWLAEAVAGVVIMFFLWPRATTSRTGAENLDDLLAPGFRPGPEEALTDRLARAMIILAAVDLVLAAFFALGHEEHFRTPTFTGVLFWYGWAGSLAWGTMAYFMPRFLGRHLSHSKLAAGGFVGWQAGVIGAFAFHAWWLLAFTTLGGFVLVLAFARPLLGSLRPRPRVVGSRRAYIHPAFRWLLVGSLALALVAVAAVPWDGPVADGAYRLTSAWVLAALFGLVGHLAFIRLGWRYPPQTLVAAVSVWTLGRVLTLWPGSPTIAGSLLMVAGAVATFLAFERNRPQQRDFVVLRGRTGA